MVPDVNNRSIPALNAQDMLGQMQNASSNMSAAMDNLLESMKATKAAQAEFANKFLEIIKSVSGLQSKLNGIEKQFKETADTVEQVADSLGEGEKAVEKMNSKVDKLDKSLTSAEKRFIANIKKSTGALKEVMAEKLDQLETEKASADVIRQNLKSFKQIFAVRKYLTKEERKSFDKNIRDLEVTKDKQALFNKISEQAEKINRGLSNRKAVGAIHGIADSISKIGPSLMGLDMAEAFNVSKAIKEYSQFDRSIRETTFLQQESASAALSIMNHYSLINETGKSIGTIQKSYVKTLQSGLKESKSALKITKQGLNLSTMTMMNEDESVETLRKYNMELGISDQKMTALSKGFEMASRSTGVLGEKMTSAVKVAEQLSKNMRNIGTLTVSAASKMAEMMAQAQKVGVGEEIQKMLDLSTKGFSGFTDALKNGDKFAQTLTRAADKAGLLNELMSGNIANDPQAMKQLGKSMETTFKQDLGPVFDKFGTQFNKSVTSTADLQEILLTSDKGTPIYKQALEALKEADAISQRVYGTGAAQFERSIKSWQDANRSFTEKLDDLKKKDKENLEGIEKTNHEFAKANLKFSESSRMLSDLSFLKDPSSLAKLMAESGRATTVESAKEKLAGMSGEQQKQEAIRAMALAANEATKATGKGKVFSESEIQKGLEAGQQEEFTKRIEDSINASSAAQTKAQSPLGEMERLLQSIEAVLQGTLGSLFGKLSFFLAPLALIATAIAQGLVAWNTIRGFVKTTNQNIGVLKERASKSGSIYVHDTNAEKLLGEHTGLLQAIANNGGGGGGRDRFSSSRRGSPRNSRGGGPRQRRGMPGRGRGVSRLVSGVTNAASFAPLITGDASPMDYVSSAGDITDIADMASSGAKGLSKTLGKAKFMPKILGKALGGGGKLLGKLAGKAAAPLDLILGGLTGFSEAEEAKQGLFKGEGFAGKAESTALGVLTGGARKGSMFSSSLGIKEGSAGDEAMGVLGSAGRGAMIGAGIGSVIPGVGTAIGGAVGAVAGAGAELYKVFTDENSELRKSLSSGVQWIGESVSGVGSWISEKTSSMGKSIWDGIKSIGSYLGDSKNLSKVKDVALSAMKFTPIGLLTSIFGLNKKTPTSEPIVPDIQNQDSASITPIVPGGSLSSDNVEHIIKQKSIGFSSSNPVDTKLFKDMVIQSSITNKHLAEMEGKFMKLVEIMNQASPNNYSPTIEFGNPALNKRPKGSANYYTWNVGRVTTQPSKAVSESQPS